MPTLKEYRVRKCLTQTQVAHELGYKGKSGYCLLEQGKVKMRLDVAFRLKKILGLTKKEFEDLIYNLNV